MILIQTQVIPKISIAQATTVGVSLMYALTPTHGCLGTRVPRSVVYTWQGNSKHVCHVCVCVCA